MDKLSARSGRRRLCRCMDTKKGRTAENRSGPYFDLGSLPRTTAKSSLFDYFFFFLFLRFVAFFLVFFLAFFLFLAFFFVFFLAFFLVFLLVFLFFVAFLAVFFLAAFFFLFLATVNPP